MLPCATAMKIIIYYSDVTRIFNCQRTTSNSTLVGFDITSYCPTLSACVNKGNAYFSILTAQRAVMLEHKQKVFPWYEYKSERSKNYH